MLAPLFPPTLASAPHCLPAPGESLQEGPGGEEGSGEGYRDLVPEGPQGQGPLQLHLKLFSWRKNCWNWSALTKWTWT